MIVAVCGLRGSGKSLFGEAAREMGFPVFEMSTPVLDEMKSRGIAITNESVRNFASELRARGGKAVVAEMLARKITPLAGKGKIVIVIGARSAEELEAFGKIDEVKCVAITSGEKERFGRISRRGKPSDPKDIESMRWADGVENDWGLGGLMEKCETGIVNDSSADGFKKKARKLLAGLGKND